MLRRKHIVKQVKSLLKTVKVNGYDLDKEIQQKYYNVKISSYKPKEKILNQKTEDRLHFENVINIVYQSTFYPLTFRVVFTAGGDVIIHFLRTTRDERRIINYFMLREKLSNIYKDFLNNNMDFWELYAKIYIK